jgi:iron-sulfur cluster assembly accessory protein
MITLTDSAVEQLRALLAQQTSAAGQVGLRLQVERGGCAGMQYTMRVDGARETDLVTSQDGACVLIDPESSVFLDGSEIDYVDDLNDAGFKINNPKAARSCGCGTSFEPLND